MYFYALFNLRKFLKEPILRAQLVHVAVDLPRLLAVKKALDEVSLRRQGLKRVRADRARAAPESLRYAFFAMAHSHVSSLLSPRNESKWV